MKKINFKKFSIYQDILKTKSADYDIRSQLSDLLFKYGNGMLAHNLCHLIFESEAEIELDERQINYLGEFIEQYCTPAIIDSFNELIT